jgi:hypothetical protein
MLKQHLKRFALVRSLHERTRVAAARLPGARRRFTQRLLTLGLVAVYFVLITPVALFRRALRRGSLAHPGPHADRGWRPVHQSSADKRIYLSDT